MKARDIIGEILAAWEDAANTAAIDCHRNAEDDAVRLLRYGVEAATGASDEQRAESMRAAWDAVENGREMAKAWRILSNRICRILRVMNVATYSQRRENESNAPAKPWERRHAAEAMAEAVTAPIQFDRAPIVIDRDKLETEARMHGLWKDDHEPQT